MSVDTTLEVIDTTDLFPYEKLDHGNTKNHRVHIVNPPMNTHIWRPGMSTQDVVDQARLMGQELIALCGHRFVPKYNPDKLPACDICISIASDIIRTSGE